MEKLYMNTGKIEAYLNDKDNESDIFLKNSDTNKRFFVYKSCEGLYEIQEFYPDHSRDIRPQLIEFDELVELIFNEELITIPEYEF